MVTCAAYGCTSRSGKDNVSFFKFPKDATKQKIWSDRIRIQEQGSSKSKCFVPNEHSKLCDKHFTEDQFRVKTPEFVKYIGYTHRVYRKLKEDALPTEFAEADRHKIAGHLRIRTKDEQNQQQQAGQMAVAGQQQGGAQTQTMVTSSSVKQPQTQHIIINSSTAGAKPQHILIQTQARAGGGDPKGDSSQQQKKANKIIAEAIAKAQKAGNTTLPRVLDPPELPSTLGDLEENDLVIAKETEKPKNKKKRSTPKIDKDKEGKGGTPKSSRKSKKERKEAAELAAEAIAAVVSQYDEEKDQEVDIEGISEADSPKKSKKKNRSDIERKGSNGTPKSAKRSKVPPATFLKVGKRKRNGSSDGSDVELQITPPLSPEDEFKRRSGRHSKRKKYLDDVDLNLSEDDLEPDGGFGGALKLKTRDADKLKEGTGQTSTDANSGDRVNTIRVAFKEEPLQAAIHERLSADHEQLSAHHEQLLKETEQYTTVTCGNRCTNLQTFHRRNCSVENLQIDMHNVKEQSVSTSNSAKEADHFGTVAISESFNRSIIKNEPVDTRLYSGDTTEMVLYEEMGCFTIKKEPVDIGQSSGDTTEIKHGNKHDAVIRLTQESDETERFTIKKEPLDTEHSSEDTTEMVLNEEMGCFTIKKESLDTEHSSEDTTEMVLNEEMGCFTIKKEPVDTEHSLEDTTEMVLNEETESFTIKKEPVDTEHSLEDTTEMVLNEEMGCFTIKKEPLGTEHSLEDTTEMVFHEETESFTIKKEPLGTEHSLEDTTEMVFHEETGSFTIKKEHFDTEHSVEDTTEMVLHEETESFTIKKEPVDNELSSEDTTEMVLNEETGCFTIKKEPEDISIGHSLEEMIQHEKMLSTSKTISEKIKHYITAVLEKNTQVLTTFVEARCSAEKRKKKRCSAEETLLSLEVEPLGAIIPAEEIECIGEVVLGENRQHGSNGYTYTDEVVLACEPDQCYQTVLNVRNVRTDEHKRNPTPAVMYRRVFFDRVAFKYWINEGKGLKFIEHDLEYVQQQVYEDHAYSGKEGDVLRCFEQLPVSENMRIIPDPRPRCGCYNVMCQARDMKARNQTGKYEIVKAYFEGKRKAVNEVFLRSDKTLESCEECSGACMSYKTYPDTDERLYQHDHKYFNTNSEGDTIGVATVGATRKRPRVYGSGKRNRTLLRFGVPDVKDQINVSETNKENEVDGLMADGENCLNTRSDAIGKRSLGSSGNACDIISQGNQWVRTVGRKRGRDGRDKRTDEIFYSNLDDPYVAMDIECPTQGDDDNVTCYTGLLDRDHTGSSDNEESVDDDIPLLMEVFEEGNDDDDYREEMEG